VKYKVTAHGPDMASKPFIIEAACADFAEMAVFFMLQGQRVSVQVEMVNATSTRVAPHIPVALSVPKGKRHKPLAHNISKRYFGDAIALYRRDKDSGEVTGEMAVAKPHHRGTVSAPLTNALGFKSPVAEADKKRFIATPRRSYKGVMDMATKGHRVQYQGGGVWGHATV
jgi:hypothetical protein